eukprot:4831143-Amphidinium_carterae.1
MPLKARLVQPTKNNSSLHRTMEIPGEKRLRKYVGRSVNASSDGFQNLFKQTVYLRPMSPNATHPFALHQNASYDAVRITQTEL